MFKMLIDVDQIMILVHNVYYMDGFYSVFKQFKIKQFRKLQSILITFIACFSILFIGAYFGNILYNNHIFQYMKMNYFC